MVKKIIILIFLGFIIYFYFPKHRPPEICIVFITCNRSLMLQNTVFRVFRHLRESEPDLGYKSILINQVTPRNDAFERLFDIHHYSPVARGFAWPFNLAYFELCDLKYISVFEDDWKLERTKRSIFRTSIDYIKNTSLALGVSLRDDSNEFCRNKSSLLCVADNHYGYGSYTNGPSVYDILRLRQLGPQPNNTELPEKYWSMKAASKGFGMLRIFKGLVKHMGDGIYSTRSSKSRFCPYPPPTS